MRPGDLVRAKGSKFGGLGMVISARDIVVDPRFPAKAVRVLWNSPVTYLTNSDDRIFEIADYNLEIIDI